MTGVMGVAETKQIKNMFNFLLISIHLGAGSSRWGDSGSGGWVPTLEQTKLSGAQIGNKADFNLLKSQGRLSRCTF